MSIVSPSMIAVPAVGRTVRSRPARNPAASGKAACAPREMTTHLGGAAPDEFVFRAIREGLRTTLGVAPGERVLTVSAGNAARPLTFGADLPFPDASFDVVLSDFGAMFAPNHRRIASELLRVCRPGGRIGLCCWTPEGFNGRLMTLLADYCAPGARQEDPRRWGKPDYLNGLFGNAADTLGVAARSHTWRYASPEDWLTAWRAHGRPLYDVCLYLDATRRAWLASDLLDLVARFNAADDGSMAVPSEYVELLLRKRACSAVPGPVTSQTSRIEHVGGLHDA